MNISKLITTLMLNIMFLYVGGCSSDTSSKEPKLDGAIDGASNAAIDSAALSDIITSLPPAANWPPKEYSNLPRGLKWVRLNPMFISALTVDGSLQGKTPDEADVNRYFDEFGATAVHHWEWGLPDHINGWMSTNRKDARWVSWVKFDGTSGKNNEVIGGFSANPKGRIGYQVGDEPSSISDLQEMEKGINAIRAVDPDALIYVNFMNTPLQFMLNYYGDMDGDVVSYDYYDLSSLGYYKHLAQFRTTGLAQKRPYWRYSKGYYDRTKNDPPMTESDLRWGALVGLTYGYTGHTFFVYDAGDNKQLKPAFCDDNHLSDNCKGETTEQFAFAAQINHELQAYGRAVTQLTSTDVRYLLLHEYAFLQPKETVLWEKGAGDDPYLVGIEGDDSGALDLAIGHFTDIYGELYVIIQNLRHTHSFPPLDLDNSADITLRFDFSSGNASPNVLYWFDGKNNDIKIVNLSNDESGTKLTRTIAAGDIFFYKYGTKRNFVLQPKY